MINTENINYPVPKQEYKVLVRCFTFNQSKYVEDALNGFAMQKTNFPFVCLVMDDASTDGEQVVIKEWMDRECDMSRAETIDIPTSNVIIVPHKTNTSCTFAFYFLKQNLFKAKEEKMKHVIPWREQCEYEALCEGDDYWIDPLKLQKQVDFLDKNPEYGLVWSKVRVLDQRGEFCGCIGKKAVVFNDLLKDNPINTLSTMFRGCALNGYSELVSGQKWLMGDYPMWLYISLKYKIRFMNDIMGVYRVFEKSASHNPSYIKQLEFLNSYYDIKFFYMKLVGLDVKKANVMNKMHYDLFVVSYNCKAFLEAVSYYKKIRFSFYKCKAFFKYFIIRNKQ